MIFAGSPPRVPSANHRASTGLQPDRVDPSTYFISAQSHQNSRPQSHHRERGDRGIRHGYQSDTVVVVDGRCLSGSARFQATGPVEEHRRRFCNLVGYDDESESLR